MPETRYLVVDLPGLDEIGINFTRRHPGTVLDELLWRVGEGPEGTYNITMLARRVPAGTMDELIGELARVSESVQTHRRDDASGDWLGSFLASPKRFEDPATKAVVTFFAEHDLEARWVRIEEGAAFVRCALPPLDSGDEVAEGLRVFLADEGIDADVDVEIATPGAGGPWTDLIAQLAEEEDFRLPFGFGL